MYKSICFITQFPPPIHGLSKAVETLFNSPLKDKYHFGKINITNNRMILLNLLKIAFSKYDLYYFTISQTKGGNWRDLLILKLLEWKRAKCLVHLHGGYYRKLIDNDCGNRQRELNYKAIKRIAGCIVLGKSLKSIFEGLTDKEKIFVVPNCVDNQYFLPLSLLEEKINRIRNSNRLNILYLSNFIETKGYREVLQLALMAKDNQWKHIQFHFAGKFFAKEEEDFFFGFIESNQLKEYITYHGIVSGDKKKNLLQQCHLFVLLTRYPNEGQPISILEAMGNAMGIITTDHAGIPDIVEDRANGLMVNKNDIQLKQIFDYIQYLDLHREALQRICKTNYSIANTRYTEAQYISNMDNVFHTVLNHD